MKKYSLDRPRPFHPLLFAAFPILFLYAFNIREMDVGDVFFPLAISVAGAFLLWALLTGLLQNARKAGLAVSLFVVLFFSYGHLYDFATAWNFFNVPHSRMIAALVLAWAYFIYFMRFFRWDPRALTKVLNLVGAALVVVNAVSISRYEVSRRPTTDESETRRSLPESKREISLEDLPDIYLLIFDEYAHPETMSLYFNYDNGEFLRQMVDRGFYIANQSRTHTLHTDAVMPSRLNMEYVTWNSQTLDQIYEMMGTSKVASFLRSKGYRYVYFGSFHELGRWDRQARQQADAYYNYYEDSKHGMVNEFQTVLWNSTMLRPVYLHLVGSQYESYHRRGPLETLAHLARMPEEEGPIFVFAHLMLPHQPFVFGPEGEFVSPANRANYSDRQIYLGQYIFASERILEMTKALLNKSRKPPVIIIQSDHGLRSHHPGVNISAEEGWKIFNAVYLPDSGREKLYNSISPVNTIRLVLNHYFSANYEMLPDDWRKPDESILSR